MGNTNKKITVPSYWNVVRPLLYKHEGDATKLCRRYPNFNPDAVPEDTCGLPYLLWACRVDHFHTVRGLLQCGASLLCKDKHGRSVLHYTCRSYTCHSCLSREYRVARLVWLLSEHSDVRATVNWADDEGWTPLHIAANSGATAIICVLLEHGGDITLKNTDGKTALDLAQNPSNRILENAQTCLDKIIELCEWRHQKHSEYPRPYRNAMRTLVVLAKVID